MVFDPRTQDWDISARVTVDVEGWVLKKKNRLGLPVILSVALDLMTYFEDEETRHVFRLPDSAMETIEVYEDFKDS